MDDRQPVSLARRALSYLICYLVAVQPMLPAMAAQITPVTPGTKMDAAGNGVPVVNIATPNGAGVSHNQYQQYNVGQEGLILNNATGQLNQTQLGGLIQNNPNLKAGQEAKAIINEVTGANRSQLQGYTEVAGKAANVMVANPYGITCNGCGFINTPNVTLTTGKPQLDANGNLSALEVTKGSVTVEGKGLDGSSADAVSIVARATEINAGIYAKDLSVTAGANRVGADGSVTPIAGEGSAPSVAVDTGALGGMYANRIHLVSSEKGVGVNLGNLAAKQGDIQLNANGKLTLGNAQSSGDVRILAQDVVLQGEQQAASALQVQSRGDIALNRSKLSAGTLNAEATGTITQDENSAATTTGSTSLSAGRLALAGKLSSGNALSLRAGQLNATHNASVSSVGNSRLEIAGDSDWQGSLTSGGDMSVTAAKLTNQGQLAANRDTTLTVQQLNNSGRIQAKGNQTLKADRLHNAGTLQAGGAQSLISQTLSSSGVIAAQQGLDFDVADGLTLGGSSTGNLLNISAGQTILSGSAYGLQGTSLQGDFSGLENSQLLSGGNLSLQGNRLSLAGLISADKQLELNADTLTSGATAQTQAQNALTGHFREATLAGSFTTPGALHFNVGRADNRALFSGETIGWQGSSLLQQGRIAADQNLDLNVGAIDQQGSLLAGNSLKITGNTLNNSGTTSAGEMQAQLTGGLQNTGSLIAQGAQTLAAAGLDNSGTLAAGDLHVQASDISNRGRIQASRSGELNGNLSNQTPGVIVTGGSLYIHGNNLSNDGKLQGQQLQLEAGDIRNGGSVLAGGPLALRAQNQLNNTGQLMGQQGTKINAAAVNNRGDILSQGALQVSAPTLDNSGKMQADSLNVSGTQLSNSGNLSALKDIALQLQQDVSNLQNGQMLAGNALTINAASLTNAGKLTGVSQLSAASSGTTQQLASGQMLSQGDLVLTAAQLTNSGRLQAQDIRLRGGGLTNSGQINAINSLDGQFTGALDHQAAGSLFSQNSLLLSAKTLNSAGNVQAGGATSLSADSLTNRGTLVTGGKLNLQLPVLVNIGWLQGNQLEYRGNSLSNSGTLISDNAGEYHFTSLENAGTLQGRDLTLSGQSLTNNGTLMAAHQLNATAGHLLNNAGGRILSAGGAVLTGSTFSQLGQIAALGDAVLKVSDAFAQRGTLAAGGHLQLSSTGNLTIEGATQGNQLTLSSDGSMVNNNKLQGGSGPLNITAANITNSASGSIQSGGAASLTSRGTLTNNGFIGAAGDMVLNSAGQLLNTALLYSTANMHLFSASLNNLRGDVLADNNLTIARNASGQANDEVVNTSGNIETANGDITISTGHLLNQRDGYRVTEETHQYFNGSADHITLTYGDFNPDQYYVSYENRCVGSGNNCSDYWKVNLEPDFWKRKVLVSETITGATATGGAGRIASGRALTILAGSLENNASSLLSQADMSLSGGQINNTSATSGRYQTWQSYDCAATGSGFFYSCSSHLKNPYVDKSLPINFYLTDTPEYVSVEDGYSYRAVIQAGTNLSANFSQNISNTSLTANAGSIGQPTIQKPALTTGISTGQVNGAQAKSLSQNSTAPGAETGWQNSLKNALGSLGNSAASLGDYPIPTGNNGLFVPTDKPDSLYLIVTNPNIAGLGKLDSSLFKGLDISSLTAPREVRSQYTDTSKVLGSSYFLDRLNLKPESDYRFLGDAAFDTRYVSNAVLSQTGQRYIHGVGSDLDQMQTLIDNAAHQQQSLGLQLGVSLTPEQVAALTESIVWWETVEIDGQKVLAPKLYLATQDVKPLTGSTILANNVSLKGGTLTNAGSTLQGGSSLSLASDSTISNTQQGVITSSGALNLSALDDIRNIGSSISGKQVALESTNGSIINQTETRQWTAAGKSFTGAMSMSRTETGAAATINASDGLKLNAGQDIVLQGSTVSSGGDMSLEAGNDVRLLANQTLSGDYKKTWRGSQQSSQSGANVSTLNSGGSLSVKAGHDLTSEAASLRATHDVALAAGNDLNLQAQDSRAFTQKHGNSSVSIREHIRQDGTDISSGGSTTLTAGRDVIAKGTQVNATGDLAIRAGRDVNLTTATESDYSYDEETKTKKGFLKKTTTHTIKEDSVTREKASQLSGNTVSVIAGNDLTVQGSSIAGDKGVALSAGHDLNIVTATNTDSTYSLKEVKKSGLMGGGLGLSYGKQSAKSERNGEQVTQSDARSLVGTGNGAVILTAGNNALIKGSDVVAGGQNGDINVTAKNIAIVAGQDQVRETAKQESKSSGFGLSLNLGPLDTVRNLRDIMNNTSSVYDQVKQVGNEFGASALDSPAPGLTYGRSDSKASQNTESVYQSGSTLNATSNLTLKARGGADTATGNILVEGSSLNAGGKASLDATRNIDITSAADSQKAASSSSSRSWSATTSASIGALARSGGGSPNNGSAGTNYGSKNSQMNGDSSILTQHTSSITAGTVDVTSHKGDIAITGSTLTGTGGVSLNAEQGNVSVVAGEDRQQASASGSDHAIGDLGGDGYSGTVGVGHNSWKNASAGTQQNTLRSGIVSTLGDVTVNAAKDVNLQGADVYARNALNVNGENIHLDPAKDTHDASSSSKSSQYGITAQVSGYGVSMAQAADKLAQSHKQSDDPRLQAIYAAQTAMTALSAYTQNTAAVKVTVSATAGSSHQSVEQSSTQQSGSVLKAGGDVAVTAKQDIAGEGVKISGDNVSLSAGRDIALSSATDSSSQKSSSGGSKYGVGVGFGLGGSQNGFSIELAASQNSANGNGSSITHHNSEVNAAGDLRVKAGEDVTLNGANLNGHHVDLDAGRNLEIASQQDRASYDSQQSSSGFSASICVPPICAGVPVQGSASMSGSKLYNDFDSVQQQSGISAGDGGYNIYVGNHTQLDGAVIASSATPDKNHLSTGTLGWTDIENHANSDGSGFSVAVSGSMGKTTTPASDSFINNIPKSGQHQPSGGNSLPVATLQQTKDRASSTTYSAISPGTIEIRNPEAQKQDVSQISRDTAAAENALKDKFDAQKAEDSLTIQKEMAALGQQTIQVTFDYLKAQEKEKLKNDPSFKGLSEAEKEKAIDKQIEEKYGIGSNLQIAAQAISGLFAGLAGGNVSGAVAAGAAPLLAQMVKQVADGNEPIRILLHTLASGLIANAQGGSAIGGAAGGLTAGLLSYNDALSHLLYGKDASTLSADEKLLIANIVTLAGAAAGGAVDGSTGVGSGASAGRTEVENNTLSLKQNQSRAHEMTQCRGNSNCEKTVIEKYKKLNDEQHQSVIGCIGAKDCVDKANDVSKLQSDYANRANELLEKARVNGSLNSQDQNELSILQITFIQLEADRTAAIHNALMSGDSPEAKQLAINSLAQAVGTSAAGIAAGVGKSGKGEGPGSANETTGKTSGAENAATYAKLKDDLIKQNLNNIAMQDPRLAAVVKGDNGKLNYGVGSGTAMEADQLGKIWVGDGARLTSDKTGLMSADRTRVYRFPASKENSSYSTTGTQANFETYKIDPTTGDRSKIGNGHLDIE
ncbi:hemagglutinin repeat-containing protein [Pantoea dispersa]|uniref:hemagglutinin repeat-containing protein n=1 Tax=Pantoea dispersa TaxID=59814 RepID=UPI002DBFE6F3|nr:hemagglutinin repeat-containing protein [Pantoea dispersa]MEB5974308.1 hemagglutinin repeat-containing protein [Pantoea dispersa]